MIIPTSKFQEQFWLLNKLAPENSAYNIPSVFKLNIEPDIAILEKAVNTIINRHDALRTQFDFIEFELSQIVKPVNSCDIKIQTINVDSICNEQELPSEIMNEVHKPFNLENAPLLRINVFQYKNDIFLTVVFHHIVVDLHSKHVFSEELSKLYNSLLKEQSFAFEEVKSQYSDFTIWHNEWLQNEKTEKSISNWAESLPKANTVLNLPIDKSRGKVSSLEGKRKHFFLSEDLSLRLKELAEQESTNSFVIFLTAYAILLNRLSQQDIVIIGVPLSNRRKEEYKDTFGCFVNAVPIAVDFSGDSSELEIRKQIRQKMLLSHRKQEIPYLSLLSVSNDKRNPAYNPYFQTGFTFEPPMNLELEGIKVESLPVERNGSQLDLFLTMWEEGNQFHAYIEYASELFNESTITRIEESFIQTITQIIKIDKADSIISILPEIDKEKIIEWNDTDRPVNTNICLHHKFEEQVRKTPNEIALKCGTLDLSYSEFNIHSNKLANYILKEFTLKPDDLICISLNRSVELMIAIYAIHKAGCAYMPIDPTTPQDRVEVIIDDAKPKLILTTKHCSKHLGKLNNKVYLDSILTNPLSELSENPNVRIDSNNLAYVLYTSGSTGKPKGVMIEHRAVINKIEWMQFKYPFGIKDCIVLKTPVTFDVSVWELFWWFFNGASLSILPIGGERNPQTMVSTIEEHKVSTIIFVPSMFSPFVEYLKFNERTEKLRTIKYIVQIGETLSPQLVMAFNQLRSNIFNPLLINTYGPTEATVAVSYYNCPEKNQIDNIYIGKPIFNTKLLIIDKNKNILPIGVAGELVISGKNLSRGYLNRPDLNADRFININYFDEEIRVYRTGDLAKWNNIGELEFIGRVDNQVKIRGYRIELGDIEAKMLSHDSIETAAVKVLEYSETNKLLVGYYILKNGMEASSENIKAFLSKVLPVYMIPAHLVLLKNMPLNTSGKIDRKSLPKPKIDISDSIIKPETKYENILVEIWEKLLNIDKIGVNNNFFDIGGDSLSAIKLINQINEELNLNIEPTALMQYSNIRELAGYLANQLDNTYTDEQLSRDSRTRRREFKAGRRR